MSEEYNFEPFTKTGSKLSNYSISVSGKSFSFGFNSGFYTKEGINNFKKVLLFFDAEKKAIGFKFTNNEEAVGVFTVIHGKSGNTGSVTAKSFIMSNGLDKAEYYGKKTPKKVLTTNFGTLFVIEL